MSDAAATAERREEILGELGEWMHAAAREAQRRLLAAETTEDFAKLTGSLAKLARGVRQSILLHRKLEAERLEAARRAGDEWVVLFEDVTPMGSHRLEMHVRTGRALHPSSQVDFEKPTPTFELEVVQLDPSTGTWLLDQPPLMPAQRYPTHEEWEARIAQARATFGKD